MTVIYANMDVAYMDGRRIYGWTSLIWTDVAYMEYRKLRKEPEIPVKNPENTERTGNSGQKPGNSGSFRNFRNSVNISVIFPRNYVGSEIEFPTSGIPDVRKSGIPEFRVTRNSVNKTVTHCLTQ